VDDLIGGVPVGDYEPRLDQMIGTLRLAGARVLVANTPHLDTCRVRGVPAQPAAGCEVPAGRDHAPAPRQVEALVVGYNAAIARVAARQGATLVDLYASGDVPDCTRVRQQGRLPPERGRGGGDRRHVRAALGLSPSPSPAG